MAEGGGKGEKVGQEPTGRGGDVASRTTCELQDHVYRHSRAARPLSGGGSLYRHSNVSDR